jgi:hypothetical protein
VLGKRKEPKRKSTASVRVTQTCECHRAASFLGRRKHSRILLAGIFLLTGHTLVFACGPGTVALIERTAAMPEPPQYNCGREFNDMLARVHKKDWKGALAAYEAHLMHLGKWEAGSANAVETLGFLRKKAEGK